MDGQLENQKKKGWILLSTMETGRLKRTMGKPEAENTSVSEPSLMLYKDLLCNGANQAENVAEIQKTMEG